ncbi:MAG: class I SAM-dependent methyltransferase [Armatimonadetes bacterium]|nr:class I SAM-dependent methyltransferase [Armatimonadota bacterium]
MFGPGGPTLLELIGQGLRSTRRGYDLLAPKFDQTPFRTADEILEVSAPFFSAPRAALDVCCGTGAVMEILRPRCVERVVGIDFSQGMLRVADERLRRVPGDARVELVLGDVMQMDFREEFDLVTCYGALGHIIHDDQPRFVDAVRRALLPGGRFVFVTSVAPPPWSWVAWVILAFNAVMRLRNWLWTPPFVMYYLNFTVARARALLEAAGFSVEVLEGRFQGPFAYLRLVIATRPRVAAAPTCGKRD